MTPAGPLTPDRAERLLALNNADAATLSMLDAAGLAGLLHQAFWTARVGDVDGFAVLLDQGAAYDSPNHAWFRQRYERFAYVDRIVVAADRRGQGIARRLYSAALDAAAGAGHTMLAAEVTSDPPNPASDAFHAAFGFTEVGRATIHGGTKAVRYLVRAVP